jgi:hypothetical protein
VQYFRKKATSDRVLKDRDADESACSRLASPTGHLLHHWCLILAASPDDSKKLFSLNSSVMDDNHDTYKTANIKINQLFLNA